MPQTDISTEVQTRLRKLSRTVKAAGFRPGKVPMSVVTQRYGYSVHYEVMNDRVGQAFSDAASEAKLRVAGPPRITPKDDAPEGTVAFDAIFEVYPEVVIGDLSAARIEKCKQRSHRSGHRSHRRDSAEAAPHLCAAPARA